MRESSVLICPDCGTSNPAGSRFCCVCGARLDAARPAPDRDREPGRPEREDPFSGGTASRTEAVFGTERIFPDEDTGRDADPASEPRVIFEGDSLIRTTPAGEEPGGKKLGLYIGAMIVFLLVASISFLVTRLIQGAGRGSAAGGGGVSVEEAKAGEEQPDDAAGSGEEGGAFDQDEVLPAEEESQEAGTVMRFPGEYGLRDTFFFNGHEYRIYDMAAYGIEDLDDPAADDDYLGYQALLEFCRERDGYLAVISDDAENSVLYQRVLETGEKSAFFACSDYEAEGYWKWAGDESSSYSNWNRASGQPNNGYVNGEQQADFGEDYAQFYRGASDGTWNDSVFAINTRLFLFEKEED